MNNVNPNANLSLENMNGEIWKPVTGYEEHYNVSNFGRIKFLKRQIKHFPSQISLKEKILKNRIGKCKYPYVNLAKNGIRKTFKIHRLVAIAFIPNLENKKCINHKDFNRSNNHVNNLEWVTSKENAQYSYKAGRFVNTKFIVPRGIKHRSATLTEETVIKIVNDFKNTETFTSLANKYNTKPRTVSDIIKGKTWVHITKLPLDKRDYKKIF